MTVPLPGPLHAQRDGLVELADLGYTDAWSAEADGTDAFTPLALAAAWEPRLRLGTAIVPAFTRAPACLAQCVASLADAAPGRFAVGIGSSSNVIVERWNGVPFVEPYKSVRDVVRFLREAMAGEKVSATLRHVRGPRLPARRASRARAADPRSPHCARACSGSPGVRPTGRSSTGCRRTDVQRVVGVVDAASGGQPREVVARIFVCPSENTDVVRAGARFAIAVYLNVPVYAEFHRWLGRGAALQPMWDAWAAGDRQAALAAIPDSVVDELVVHGSPEVVPGADPGVLRQRRHHVVAGAAPPRSRRVVLGRREGAGPRCRVSR